MAFRTQKALPPAKKQTRFVIRSKPPNALKEFILCWLDGTTQIVTGVSIDDACLRSGITKEKGQFLGCYGETLECAKLANDFE
jgi:hypothetical protein